MKKCILFLLLVLSSITSIAQETDRMQFLLSRLYDGGKSDYVMIFAHRGDWRNAPENSLQSYQNCIDAGIDGIEIDVRETKDGKLVVIHDETLDRTTTGNGKVSDYTLDEIRALKLRNPIGVVVNQKVPTLEEVFELAKGNILIQVDKWQAVKEKVIEEARKHNIQKQIILRGTTSSEHVKKTYGHLLEEVNYIPVVVCNGKDDDRKLNDFMENIPTKVISLSFKADTFAVINRASEIKKRGFRIWYNSMWSTFNGGHDDELAVYDTKNSYGWLLDKGANIIFSDRPLLLDSYLKKIGRR